MREIYKRRIGVENAPQYEEGDEIMKMKTKRFLSVVAMVLAFLIAFNTTSVAMGTAADYISEVTAAENITEDGSFMRQEKIPTDNEDQNTVTEDNLRLPDVQNGQSPEEAEYGEPIQIDKNSKVYQTGERSFKTVFSEIPNTFKNEFGI